MGNLEKKLVETVKNETKKFENDSQIDKFMQAEKEFDEMVKKGLAKRRGNNLLPADEVHLKKFSINA